MRPRGRFKCKNNALGTYMKIILTTYLLLYSTEKRNFASLRSQTENEKAVFGNIQHAGHVPLGNPMHLWRIPSLLADFRKMQTFR